MSAERASGRSHAGRPTDRSRWVLALLVPALAAMACGRSDGSTVDEGDGDGGGDAVVSAGDDVAGYGGVEEAYRGRGPKVVVLGDSIMVAARQDLRELLADHATKFAAVAGEGLGGGAISTLAGRGGMVEVADRYRGDRPDVAVIALGTNDAWLEPLTLAGAEAALPRIVESLGARCVVTVTVSHGGTPPTFDADLAAGVDVALTAVADEVVDWGAVADRPGSLRPDGIHPTALGARRLAEAIAAAVRRCEA